MIRCVDKGDELVCLQKILQFAGSIRRGMKIGGGANPEIPLFRCRANDPFKRIEIVQGCSARMPILQVGPEKIAEVLRDLNWGEPIPFNEFPKS